MRDAGGPRRGRHSLPDEGRDDDAPSWGAGSSFWAEEPPEREPAQDRTAAADWERARSRHGSPSTAERAYRAAYQDAGDRGAGRRSGVLERWPDETGPETESRHRPGGGDGGSHDDAHGGRPDDDPAPRAGRDAGPAGGERPTSRHPSGPLPPMPRSGWSRLSSRRDAVEDDETAAADLLPPADRSRRRRHAADDDWDRTGGLEVIGAHVEEEARRRGLFRRRPAHHAPEPGVTRGHEHDGHAVDGPEDDHHDFLDDDLHPDELHPDDLHELHDDDPHELHDDDTVGHPPLIDDDIPIAPYDPGPQRRRKRRKRVGLFVCLVLLVALVGGVVVGGQKLWGVLVPQDYTGQGTGTVKIRITEGETLTAIGQTMVDQDVIASVRPFVTAANANPQSTSIAPGIYGLHKQMSGKAALDLLLKPSSRLVSRVTLPEGLTVKQTLDRLSQGTGVPLAQLQAAAADTASLGLPAYANGSLEGFLYPSTYDFEPGTTPQQMLTMMITRGVQLVDQLQIPANQRLTVLTKASIVQAEAGSAADMPKVARVIENRLAQGMLLQLDTTVNYATGKTGLTTTDEDRANPSPYNTYVHAGLPPGPITNPGEEALRAVLSPAPGAWMFFVVVNPDTGETRFAVTAEEHQQNVALFQAWLRAHPGG